MGEQTLANLYIVILCMFQRQIYGKWVFKNLNEGSLGNVPQN